MKLRLLLAMLVLLPFTVSADEVAADAAIQGSYFAVIVSDIEAARNWYQTVLGLEDVSRAAERGHYDIINMAGPGLFVELLKLDAAGLPAAASQAEIVYDRKNNVLILQLKDPDNNTVQVMQKVDDE
jgi:catechol 2,3-dioxygenase-like lactoylglutathione lyase family enzyme